MSVTVRGGSVALIALGASVLAGWALDVSALTTVAPGLASMKPNTALCFALVGTSLALWSASDTSQVRWASRALGVAVAILGALTVAEYTLDWDGGFDARLFPGSARENAGPYPMRMSEVTAVAFVLAGVALVLLPTAAWKVVQGMTLGVAAIAIMGLVGYWYGVRALYALSPYSSVAIHTALGLLVTSVVILCTAPERGLVGLLRRQTLGGLTARRLLPIAVAFPLVFGWLWLVGRRAGLYEIESGMGLFAVGGIVLFISIVWAYAGWLDRAELRRMQLEVRLLQSQKMEAIGQLAAGVAHDAEAASASRRATPSSTGATPTLIRRSSPAPTWVS